MGLYNDKHRLFADYVDELNAFRPGNEILPDDARELCDHYISSSDCTWKNIFAEDTGELIGFLIIGKAGEEKHPDAERSMKEAYVVPEYRRKGLMKAVIVDYESRHHSTYSILVQPANEDALHFWEKVYTDMNYKPIELDASKIEVAEEMVLLGYAPKK